MSTIKRHHWTLALGAVAGMVLGAGLLAATTGSEAGEAEVPDVSAAATPQQQLEQLEQQGQTLIRVATIEGIEANQEFQRNVRLIQSQRQRVIQIGQQIDATDDDAERSRLETERDVMLDRLNDNNRRMIEAYGFSLARNYVMMVEKSHVYLAVSEEEAQRYRELQQQRQQQAPTEPADD